MLVREWFAQWPAIAPTLRPRNAETIEHTIQMAGDFGRKFASRRMDSLEPWECARWASRNRGRMRFVKTVLGDAVTAKVIESNPMSGLKPPPPVRGEYVPSRDEVLALIRAGASRGLSDLIAIAAGTGARRCELAALQVGDVSPGPNERTLLVRIRAGKRGPDGKPRPRTVVASGTAVRPLNAVLCEPESDLVLRTKSGGIWTRAAVSEMWVPTRELVGLPAACTFHSLRKFYATGLLDAGVSDIDTAVALGHLDKNGYPDPTLVRKVYGRPSLELSIARIAEAA